MVENEFENIKLGKMIKDLVTEIDEDDTTEPSEVSS